MKDQQEPQSEQGRYATVLHWSAIAGFATLVVTFVAYMSGALPAYVPLDQLPHLWSLPAEEFLKATHAPVGWGWIFSLRRGDFASEAGIAILSGCSIVCILAIMPAYARRRDFIYLAICALEIVVLVASAAGMFSRH